MLSNWISWLPWSVVITTWMTLPIEAGPRGPARPNYSAPPPKKVEYRLYDSNAKVKSIVKPDRKRRVAIIGGGAGGSSVAYYLKKAYLAKKGNPEDLDIVLYEQSKSIGGRVDHVTMQFTDCFYNQHQHVECIQQERIVEQGASVYSKLSMNMASAVVDLGLRQTEVAQLETAEYEMKRKRITNASLGIWDGASWKLRVDEYDTKTWKGWFKEKWFQMKLMWRYWSTQNERRIERMAMEAAPKLDKMHDLLHDGLGFLDLKNLFMESGLMEDVSTVAKQELRQTLNRNYINEVVGGKIKGYFGQTLDQIHSLAAKLALIWDSAYFPTCAIDGGNALLFQHMAESSAHLKLSHRVNKIVKNNENTFTVYSSQTQETRTLFETEEFDHVVVAVPQPHDSIIFKSFDGQLPSPVNSISLYSTIVQGLPNLEYFQLRSFKKFPRVITVPDSNTQDCPFVLFQVRTWINASISTAKHYPSLSAIVRILSTEPLEEFELDDMFVRRTTTISRKWEARPARPLQDVKAPVLMDSAGAYYLNRMEEFVSTMETETLAGLNIVNLIMNQWLQQGVFNKH